MRKRRSRKLLTLLLLAAGLAVAACLAVYASLASSAVRQRVLAKVSERLEAAVGLRLSAQDWRLELLAGRLSLEQPSVSATDQAGPFLEAQRLEARFHLRALLASRLASVELSAPRLDLERLPATEPDAPEQRTQPEWQIERLAVREGQVVGLDLSSLQRLAEAAGVEEIELEGSLAEGRFIGALKRAVLHTEGGQLDHRRFVIAAAVDLPLAGPFEIEQLSVTGEGLELQASLLLGLEETQPLLARFELQADAARLLPQTAGGQLQAAADLDLRRRSGRLRASATSLPGLLLFPFLDEEAARRIALEQTYADGELELEATPGGIVAGRGSWHWQRGEVLLARGDLEIVDGRFSDDQRLDLRSLRGRIGLDVDAAPAELLLPWVSEQPVRQRLLGSELRAAVQVGFGDGVDGEGAVDGSANVTLSRAGETQLSLRLDEGHAPFDDQAIDLELAAGLLEITAPDLPSELLSTLTALALGEPAPTLDALLAGTRLAVDLRADARQARSDIDGRLRVGLWQEDRNLVQLEARSREGGRDRAGRFDPGDVVVEASVELPPLELERLRDVLPDVLSTRAELLTTTLEASLRLSATRAGLQTGTSVLEARWLDGSTPLLEIDARSTDAAPLAIAAEARLLPEIAGERRFAAALRASGWSELLELEGRPQGPQLDHLLLELSSDDLGANLRAIKAALPAGLVPTATVSTTASEDSEEEPAASLLERLALGSLSIELEGSGPLLEPDLTLTSTWRPHSGGALQLGGDVRLRRRLGEPGIAPEGTLSLTGEQIDLSAFELGSGRLSLNGTIAAESSDVAATLAARVSDLEIGEHGPRLDLLELVARSDGESIELVRATAQHATALLRADGRAELAWPPKRAGLRLEASDRQAGVESASFDVTLTDDVLEISAGRLLTDAGEGDLELSIPLSSLGHLPAGERFAEIWDVAPSDRPIRLVARLPELDSRSLLPFLGLEERSERLQARGVELELDLRPQHPLRSRGLLTVDSLEFRSDAVHLEVPDPIRARIDRGRIELEPLVGLLDDQTLRLAGSASFADRLAPDMIETLQLDAEGTIDAARLNPFLLGGAGSGLARARVEIAGPLDDLRGKILVDGREARLDYVSPYISRFENLQGEITLAQGKVEITKATARLNEGQLTAAGVWSPTEGTVLDASIDDVRYYLDYGLSAVLAGDVSLQFPPEGQGSITGEVLVERALVRRSVNLERELLQRLFAPTTLQGPTEETTQIALDLRIVTRDGVRVRNNVADLRATWSPILVRGTLGEPLIEGVVDVVPGGFLLAYGQTLRLDRATLTLYGQPGAEPSLELVTTSSLEDPEIARRGATSLDPFAYRSAARTAEEADTTNTFGRGLTEHFGERVATSAGALLGGALGDSRMTIRPMLILTESDPDARLHVGRDLTENLALGVSINLRQAERRTYLLDLHRIPRLHGFQTQLFTNELDNEGVTLQQTLSFSGTKGDEAPILRRVEIEILGQPAEDREGLGPRALRRAITLENREPLPDGALFDAEIELTEALLRRGYTQPRIEVRNEPIGTHRVAIVATVDPGPRTEVRFEGIRPPARARTAIASLYRSDFSEATSLTEMQRQTASALRAMGYLDPVVELSVEPRAITVDVTRVTIFAAAERRVGVGTLGFPGLTEEVTAALQERFSTTLSRVELAAGEPGADLAVTRTLAALGYSRASVVARRLSDDGRTLEVSIEPGPRQRIASVTVSGAPAEMQEELVARLELDAGQPLISSRVARAAIDLELELRRRGHTDARVQAALEPRDEETVDVELRVEPGPLYRLAEVRVEGTRNTRRNWAESLAEAAPGPVPTAADLADIRRRYYETGLFDSVFVDTRRHPEEEELDLLIGLQERDRYTFAYGARWESDEGGGLVVDLLDRNLLGRGVGLGARGLLTETDWLGRLYATLPRVLGSRYTVETFGEIRSEEDSLTEEGSADTTLFTDALEASLQLARPFGRFNTGRIYGRYRQQDFLTVVEDPFVPIELEERLKSPFLGLQYIYNRPSPPRVQRRSLFASADLSGSDEALGSDVDYLRFFGQVALHRPLGRLGQRPLGWSQSYRVGLANALDDRLSRDLRFFAGGEYSVRGYPRESLGPVQVLGPIVRPAGGEALFVLNQELHFPIWGPVHGLTFFDAGNVWETAGDVQLDLFTSLGLGLRYSSPIGLLRFDVGFPLNGREDDSSAKFYFGFGQVF